MQRKSYSEITGRLHGKDIYRPLMLPTFHHSKRKSSQMDPVQSSPSLKTKALVCVQRFIFQVMHTLKNAELLKY